MDAVVAHNRAAIVAEKLGEHYWYCCDETQFSKAAGFALLMGSSGCLRSYPGN